VRVLAASRVRPACFHARFDAARRTYLYRVHAGAAPPALPLRAAVWHVPRPPSVPGPALDVASMRAAAALLVGRHDFSTFRAAGCAASSPVRTLERLAVHEAQPWAPHPAPPPWLPASALASWSAAQSTRNPAAPRHDPMAVVIEATAPSFLYHQVRRLVGALVRVGTGRLRPADVAALLEARDGAACPAMAPAHGLTLADVAYSTEATAEPGDDDDAVLLSRRPRHTAASRTPRQP
jgi:tRNA pseudouridine38-40 synthase